MKVLFLVSLDRKLWSYCIRTYSDNSNLTLAVHSPKLNQAKNHFLSHLGGKKEKIWLDQDLNPQSVD